jgi:hypothetical protein
MFKQGWVYRHNTSRDLDILVIKVRYKDSKRSKLLIKWISKFTGDVRYLPSGRMDGTDNIEIQAKDYKYWSQL